jgi:hypothetical protein
VGLNLNVALNQPPLFGSLPVAGFKIVGIEFWGPTVNLQAEQGGDGDGKIRLQITNVFRLKRPDGSTLTLFGGTLELDV